MIALQLQKVSELDLRPTELNDVDQVLMDVAKNNNLSIGELVEFRWDRFHKIMRLQRNYPSLNLQRFVTRELEKGQHNRF
ncbi:MAG: hypothetical protein ACJ0HV_04605 [Candidatus Pseudothioglobus sp.]